MKMLSEMPLKLEYVRAINKKKNPNLARVPDGIVVSRDIHLSIASLMAVGSWNIDKDIQS